MTSPGDRELAEPLFEQIRNIHATLKGRRLAQAGLMVSLCYDNRSAWSTRGPLLDAIRYYLELVGQEKVTWWVRNNSSPQDIHETPIASDELESCARDSQQDISFAMASGNPPPAKCLENAQDYQFEFSCLAEDVRGAGTLTMSFPVDWVLTRSPEDNFVSVVNELVARTQPLHGTAGIGLATPLYPGGTFNRNMGESFEVYPLVKRYPGLEVHTRLHMPYFLEGMYSVNWLNVVSEPLLFKLGGRETVKAQCRDAALRTQDIGGCLMIQAGPGPAPGDNELGLELPHYQAAARILKPIRVTAGLNPCIAPPPWGMDDSEMAKLATNAYLSRFDENPVPYPV